MTFDLSNNFDDVEINFQPLKWLVSYYQEWIYHPNSFSVLSIEILFITLISFFIIEKEFKIKISILLITTSLPLIVFSGLGLELEKNQINYILYITLFISLFQYIISVIANKAHLRVTANLNIFYLSSIFIFVGNIFNKKLENEENNIISTFIENHYLDTVHKVNDLQIILILLIVTSIISNKKKQKNINIWKIQK